MTKGLQWMAIGCFKKRGMEEQEQESYFKLRRTFNV